MMGSNQQCQPEPYIQDQVLEVISQHGLTVCVNMDLLKWITKNAFQIWKAVVNNGAHREIQDYELTVDMAKHLCLMSR